MKSLNATIKTTAVVVLASVGHSLTANATPVVCHNKWNVKVRLELSATQLRMTFNHPAWTALSMRNPGVYRDGHYYFRDDRNVVRAIISPAIFQGARGQFNYLKIRVNGRGGMKYRFECN